MTTTNHSHKHWTDKGGSRHHLVVKWKRQHLVDNTELVMRCKIGTERSERKGTISSERL